MMKKRVLLKSLFAVSLILLISFQLGLAESLQHIFTGLASNQNVDVSIFVEGPPLLLLYEPLNETYLINTSLPLSYLIDGADNAWYNIDNGNNLTISNSSSNYTFNISEGSHFLRLFANNSLGITEDNVTFSVNLTKLIIPTAPTPTGGRGAEIIPVPQKDLKVSPTEIKIKMTPGDVAERTLYIKNTGKLSLSVTISSNLDFLSIEESRFILFPNEEKAILIKFTVPKDAEPELYSGYISVAGDGIERIIPVSLEIESKIAKFSVDIMIPSEFKTLKPKDELKTQITIFNVSQSVLGKSATITYIIKNISNGIVLEGSELTTLTEQVFFKTFVLPSLAEGKYVVYVSLKYENMVASDSDTFNISLVKPAPGIFIFGIRVTLSWLIIALIIILAIIITALIKRTIKFYKKHRDIYLRDGIYSGRNEK